MQQVQGGTILKIGDQERTLLIFVFLHSDEIISQVS